MLGDMAITPASLKAEFPDMQSFADEALEGAIRRAERMHPRGVLGEAYDDVVSLYACHLAVSARMASAGGASSVTAGPVSVTYGGTSSATFLDMYEDALNAALKGRAGLPFVSGMS